MKDKDFKDFKFDTPWEEYAFEETDECLLLRAKVLARAEMLSRLASLDSGKAEDYGSN